MVVIRGYYINELQNDSEKAWGDEAKLTHSPKPKGLI